eukprot:4384588-Pleurochrysis_carterae.AAC.1
MAKLCNTRRRQQRSARSGDSDALQTTAMTLASDSHSRVDAEDLDWCASSNDNNVLQTIEAAATTRGNKQLHRRVASSGDDA